MNRRVMAGLSAAIFLSIGSLAIAPRTASAAMAVATCDSRLALCSDNAADNFDDCVCNLYPNLRGCYAQFTAQVDALAPNSPNSIPACVVQEQGDLVKCQGTYLLCKIVGGGNPITAPKPQM
jgi:hypothetical protein